MRKTHESSLLLWVRKLDGREVRIGLSLFCDDAELRTGESSGVECSLSKGKSDSMHRRVSEKQLRARVQSDPTSVLIKACERGAHVD